MNYYPFHIGDYTLKTRHLTEIEDLVYRRMLDLYYITEKPLPDDFNFKGIATRIQMPRRTPEIKKILSEFFDLQPDGWHNKQADQIIAEYQRKANSARSALKKRWKKSEEKSTPQASQEF